MDVFDFINNNGSEVIPNPDYNPKSKKNTVPKYINRPIINSNNSEIVDFVNKGLRSQTAVDSKLNEKYTKYGLEYNNWENVDKQLAERQSNWEKGFNALAQIVVSEIGIGSVKGLFDIGDYIWSNVFGLAEKNYSNPVSQTLGEWREQFEQNVAPIHVDPDVDIQNGGLTNFGWYMKNTPSIFSSVSLLLPGLGYTKAINALGTSLKVGKGIGKARRWAANIGKAKDATNYKAWQVAISNPVNIKRANEGFNTITTGLMMRTAENYQEASDVHSDMYEKAADKLNNMSDEEYQDFVNNNKELFGDKTINPNDKNSVAKTIAKKAADKTFQMDMGNLIFDVIQLHSLKNIGAGISKATGRKVALEQKKSLEAAKAYTEGSKIADKTVGFKDKAKNAIGTIRDVAKYNGKTILAESTEGIEEAVNYIAQQEGITYGNLLLEGKGDGKGSPLYMDKDLNEYLKSAELQENAFWGVIGGWVFSGVGTGLRKAKLAIDRKADEKAQQENPITGEKVNANTPWSELFDMPDVKAARVAIRKRQARLEQLATDIKRIKDDNINIFGKADKDGKLPQFTPGSELEKRIAIERVQSDFQKDIALDALNSGTYDLLVDYFQSDEVKDAVVKAGLTNENEVDSYITDTVKTLEQVKKTHEEQSAHVLNQLGYLNAATDTNEDIPLEYAQLIADNNTRLILENNKLDKQIDVTNALINEQVAILDKTGIQVNPFDGDYVKIGAAIDAYTRLIVDEKALSKQPDSFDKERNLKKIKEQKEVLLKKLYNSTIAINENQNIEAGYAAIAQAIRYSNRFKNENGKVIFDKDSIELTDEELASNVKEAVLSIGDVYEYTGEESSIIQQAKNIATNIDDIINNKDGLYSRNKELFNLYASLGYLETQKLANSTSIAVTIEQIATEVDYWHNSMNEARVKAIDKSENIIRNAFLQYAKNNEDNANTIKEIIRLAYIGDKTAAKQSAEQLFDNNKDNNRITSEDFFDALDIINFTSKSNNTFYEYINSMLNKATRDMFIEEEKKPTDLDSSSDIENDNTNNPSSNNQKGSESAPFGEGMDLNRKRKRRKRKNQQISDTNDNSNNDTSTDTNFNSEPFNAKLNYDKNSKLIITKTEDKNEIAATVKYINNDEVEVIFNNNSRAIGPIKRGHFEANDIDLINDEWAIIENPTYVKDGNGKFVINKKGRIVRTNGIDITDNGTTASSPSSPVEGVDGSSSNNTVIQEASTTNIIDNTAPEASPSSSQTPSTGELDNSETSSSNGKLNALETEADLVRIFSTKIPSITDSNIDIDAIGESIRSEVNNQLDKYDITQDELNSLIDKTINKYKDARDIAINMKNKLAQTGSALAYTARYEEVNNDFSSLFVNTAEAFMKEYKKVIVVPNVDGKQLVRLTDILRICNNLFPTSDNNIAKGMYNVIRKYLLDDSDKYYIADLDKGEDVINDVIKSVDELNKEAIDTFDSFSVNIQDFIKNADNLSEEEREKYFKLLDSINNGDTLKLIKTDKEFLITKNGEVIGNMSLPKIDGDKYFVYNSGWRTDIRLVDDTIESDCKDIIEDIFLTEDDVHNQLRTIIAEYIKTNKEGKDIKPILKKFANNPIISNLIKQSKDNLDKRTNLFFVHKKSKNVDINNIIDYLANLWNFSDNITTVNKQQNKENIRKNLDNWFRKLYYTYDTLNNIKGDIDVTVDNITQGELIRITDDTLGGYNELEFSKNGLADTSISRIGIYDGKSNTFKVSGKDNFPVRKFDSGSTLVAIYGKNKKPDFAKIIGVKLNDKEKSNNAPLISKLYRQAFAEIEDALYNAFNAKDKDLTKVVDIIKNLVRCKNINNRIALFAPVQGSFEIEDSDAKDGFFTVNYSYENRNGTRDNVRFRFYGKSSKDGRPMLGYSVNINGKSTSVYQTRFKEGERYRIVEEIVNQFNGFVYNYCNINISKIGIESDNGEHSISEGYITNKNGKININIGNINETYDSYNDYLIQNNLVKVNTKINDKGSNYERKSNNPLKEQKLYISLPINTERKTETKKENQGYIEPNSDKKVIDDIKDITDNPEVNAGVEIFNRILGTEEIDRFNDIVEVFNDENSSIDLNDIFPSTIKYNPFMNRYKTIKGKYQIDGAVAYSSGNNRNPYYHIYKDGKRKTVRIPRTIDAIIGDWFMNMASSNEFHRRKTAIRKLIHENIHKKLGEDSIAREKLFKELVPIYNELMEHVINDITNKNTPEAIKKVARNIYSTFKEYVNKTDENSINKRLEELLCESITNEEFFIYMNNIQVEDVGNTNVKENLFSKIARIIAEFFGWKIKDNSLYLKELNAIRRALSDENTNSLNEEIAKENNNEELPETLIEAEPIKTDNIVIEDDLTDDTISDEDAYAQAMNEDIDDYDDYSFIDDDDIAYEAKFEEIQIDIDGYIQNTDINSFVNRFPGDIQARMRNRIASGEVSVKC